MHNIESPALIVSAVGVEACHAVSLAGIKEPISGLIKTSYTSFAPLVLRSTMSEIKRMLDKVQGMVGLKCGKIEERHIEVDSVFFSLIIREFALCQLHHFRMGMSQNPGT
jgi:hypothetical protein